MAGLLKTLIVKLLLALLLLLSLSSSPTRMMAAAQFRPLSPPTNAAGSGINSGNAAAGAGTTGSVASSGPAAGGGNTVAFPSLAPGLSPNFYSASCPQLNQIVQNFLTPIILANPGQAAGILRIFFHDCFVQGCDASLLLLAPITELIATPNNQSIRLSSVALLDNVKAAIEQVCPGVVSCADTIAISTAVAVRLVGGPAIPMATGRRDAQLAATNQTVVNNIPPPTLSITALKQNFQNHGLNSADLVALSGGHSIGRAHCRTVDLQLSPVVSPDLNPGFAANLSRICLPASSQAKQRLTVHLDFITMDIFDNAYFQNVLAKRAVFHTDAELLNATDTRQLVQLYAQNQPLFFQQFTASMLKMSQLGVLTGNQGVIRRRCTS